MQPKLLGDIGCLSLLIICIKCSFCIVYETLEISVMPYNYFTISIRKIVEAIVGSILHSRLKGCISRIPADLQQWIHSHQSQRFSHHSELILPPRFIPDPAKVCKSWAPTIRLIDGILVKQPCLLTPSKRIFDILFWIQSRIHHHIALKQLRRRT